METQARGIELFLVRVGDAERDACIEALAEHHIRGRLSVEELDRRQRAALSAVTAADLAVLVADLPVSSVPVRHDRPVPFSDERQWFDPRKARTAAKWAVPPVALVTTSALLTPTVYAFSVSDVGIFTVSIATGAVGFASHWVVSRLRRH